MKKIFATLAAALVLVAANAADANWQTDLPKAQAQAAKEKKMVLLDFTGSDWCGWCKELDKKTYSDAKVIAFAKDKLVSVKVDTETPDGAKLQQKFEVSGLPTIMFLDGDGKVQGKIVGFKPAAPFLAKMEIVNKAFKEMPAMLAKLKTQ